VADSARVFLTSIVKFMVQRREELGSAAFDKVRRDSGVCFAGQCVSVCAHRRLRYGRGCEGSGGGGTCSVDS